MGRQLRTFQDFIGQRRVVRHLERLIRGALAHGEAVGSLLLIARPGSGKTAMARAVAAAYGSELHALTACGQTQPSDLYKVLLQLRHGDVFFVDEAHSLTRDAQQALYKALDERLIPAAAERGARPNQLESIAEFTLVLATNEPGSLKHALLRRLLAMEFDPYTQRELKEIAGREAADLPLPLTPQAAGSLAAVAQGSPRRVARLVADARHFWADRAEVGTEEVRRFLRSQGIDEHGLTPLQRHYLCALAATPAGRLRLEALAGRLGCDTRYVRLEVEPYLVELGLVDPCSEHGRALTRLGREAVEEASERGDHDPEDNDEHINPTCK